MQINAAQRRAFSDSGAIDYGRLVWAAGGRPRRLCCEGCDLDGVHVLRNLEDADHLKVALADARRAVIVGGGYIGLEAAAVFAAAGCAVTVLEAQSRLLTRGASHRLAAFVEQYHQARGVYVRKNCVVTRILGDLGRVKAVELQNGEIIPADLVLVGIGIVPNVEPLCDVGEVSSISYADGIEVNQFCQTSLPGVWAIGDCARYNNPFANGAMIRLESVQNALGMAQCAAKNLLGTPTAYRDIPWFWSDQNELRIQVVGLLGVYDEAMVRGSADALNFSILYLREGRLQAAECINAPKDFMQAKRFLGAFAKDRSALSDPMIPLHRTLAM